MKLTVDASIVVKWFVTEPLSDDARCLLSHRIDLHAPDILLAEFANTIWKKARLREIADPRPYWETGLVDRTWRGAQGLAEDVRRYGRWMRDEAEKRIGHLYPILHILITSATPSSWMASRHHGLTAGVAPRPASSA